MIIGFGTHYDLVSSDEQVVFGFPEFLASIIYGIETGLKYPRGDDASFSLLLPY